ncbi:MAG: hypothetical protein KC589_04940, partial [Nanoarchaeota archaeon]|nr:hypothetical protein [Nanoarchaeota archaeon]
MFKKLKNKNKKERITIESLILISFLSILINNNSEKIQSTIQSINKSFNPNLSDFSYSTPNYFKKISFKKSQLGYLTTINIQEKTSNGNISISGFIPDKYPQQLRFKEICFKKNSTNNLHNNSKCYKIWPKTITKLFPQGKLHAYTRTNPYSNNDSTIYSQISQNEIKDIEMHLLETYF